MPSSDPPFDDPPFDESPSDEAPSTQQRTLPSHWSEDPAPPDLGAADPALTAALLERAAGRTSCCDVVAGLRAARLLVPLVEVDSSQLRSSDLDPCAGQDKAMAAPNLLLPDGASATLAFTGLPALAHWNPTARPLPVPAKELAGRVLKSGGRALIVDLGSPTACTLRPLALLRLATGEPCPPLWEDPYLRQALAAEFAPELATGALALRPAPPDPPADLRMYVRPGEWPEDPEAFLASLRTRVAASPALRAVCADRIEIVLTPA